MYNLLSSVKRGMLLRRGVVVFVASLTSSVDKQLCSGTDARMERRVIRVHGRSLLQAPATEQCRHLLQQQQQQDTQWWDSDDERTSEPIYTVGSRWIINTRSEPGHLHLLLLLLLLLLLPLLLWCNLIVNCARLRSARMPWSLAAKVGPLCPVNSSLPLLSVSVRHRRKAKLLQTSYQSAKIHKVTWPATCASTPRLISGCPATVA